MVFLNTADTVYLGATPVIFLAMGEERVWPASTGSQPIVSNLSSLGRLTITWAESDPPIDSYKLKRNGVEIADQVERTYIDSGLTWGQTYSYTVTPVAFGIDGTESVASIPVTIPYGVGNAPLLSVPTSSGNLNVTWAETPGADIYELSRNGVVIATQSSRIFNDSGLTWGQTYSYTVRPRRNGIWGTVSPASQTALIPYGAVGTVSPSAQSYTNVTLSWDAVSGADSYRVYKNDSLYSTTTELNVSVSTTEDTSMTLYVVPYRNGIAGTQSQTHTYYSGREEVRDQGSITNEIFQPQRVDSWRPVDDWAWLSNIAAQGYYTASYGNYKGVMYYGSNGVRDALRSRLGGGTLGTNRQLRGSCTKAEVYLYKKKGVGSSGQVQVTLRRSNSTASGSEPSGSGEVTRTSTSSGSGKWYDITPTNGQYIGDGDRTSIMIRQDGSANYAHFTDCRLRLSWSWNYISVSQKASTWI